MTKITRTYHQFAAVISALLSAALLVCANTNSCLMVHQPEAPKDLHKFSKIK